jgi:SMP-30/Gluconolactonase/LRE-like region
LREIQHPGQIDIDDAPPADLVDFHELHRLGDSGVVDENVDVAESVNGFRSRFLARCQIGDVASEAQMITRGIEQDIFRGRLRPGEKLREEELWSTQICASAQEDFLDGQNFAENYRNLPWDGRVYELDPIKGKVLRILDRRILFTNGIAFGPDDALYANASFTGHVYRYDVFGPERPTREVFGNVLQPFEGDDFRGPDGMCWGDDGRLYCTVYGQRNVTVLNKDGSLADGCRSTARTRPIAPSPFPARRSS